MADKRISQLVERTDIANNDVVAIVASGATVTNKATISSIQSYLQTALDVGVTSVGVTLGSSGTDVSVTGSPITTSGNITINIPSASATNRGVLTSEDWSTFNAKQPAGNYLTTDTTQTITGAKTFDQDIFVNGRRIGRGSGNITSNTTVGNAALRDNTTGSENSAFGGGALRQITTGSGNTAVGFGSMLNSETGGGNTAIGNATLAGNNGSNNIAVGNSAGRYIAGGTTINETSLNSVYLGVNTRPSADGNTNEIVIGHNAVGNGSNTVTIGNSSITSNKFFGRVIHADAVNADESATLGQVNTSLSGFVTLDTAQTITGEKTFTNNIILKNSALAGLIVSSFSPNALEIGATLAGITYYSSIVFPAGDQSWNLPNASGTIALTSDLGAYVTLGTAQTITAQKTISTSGGDDTLIVNHTSGSGIALDIAKAGNGEGLRVAKSSGTGNAVTITGGLLSAEATTLTGALNGTSASFSGNGLFGGSSAVSGLAGGISVNGSTNSGINFRIADALRGYVYVAGNGSMNLESTSGSIVLSPNGTPAVTIASTGAATFSSSVTAAGDIRIQDNFSLNLGYNQAGGATLKYNSNGNLDITPRLGYSTVFTAGNVGIGTASPATFGSFVVRKATSVSSVNVSASFSDAANSTFDIRHNLYGTTNLVDLSAQGGVLTLSAGNAEAMRITSGQNIEAVGSIKTGNPSGSTARPFKIGDVVSTASGSHGYQDRVLKVDINGTVYNLAIADPIV